MPDKVWKTNKEDDLNTVLKQLWKYLHINNFASLYVNLYNEMTTKDRIALDSFYTDITVSESKLSRLKNSKYK